MHIDPKQRIKESELNMTPMIDVVFLLITFFMVVSEITRQDDIEDIKLPLVMAAIPDDNPDPDRLVINVLKNGDTVIGGRTVDDQELFGYILAEARSTRDSSGVSKRLILIKADENTPFQYIRRIMMMCTDQKVKIWRMSFGTEPIEAAARKRDTAPD